MDQKILENFKKLSPEQQDKIIYRLTKIVAAYQQQSSHVH